LWHCAASEEELFNMAVKGDAARNGMISRLVDFMAKSATSNDIIDILGDAQVAKAELPVTESRGEPIRDYWSEGEDTPTAGETVVGPEQQASGGAEPRAAAAHSNFAPQQGAQKDAEKLGEMMCSIRDLAKSVKALGQQQDLIKAAVINLAKAKPVVKADDEAGAEGEKEATSKAEDTMQDEEEFGIHKSLKPILAEVNPMLVTAKSKLATAASMAKSGMAKSAGVAKFQAAEIVIKAESLVNAALALAPHSMAVAKAADSLALIKAECDDEEKEMSKAEDKPEDKETAKSSVGIPPDVIAKLNAAVAGHDVLKGKLSDIFDVMAGHKQITELAKAMPSVQPSATAGGAGLQAQIFLARDEGKLSENETAAALDLAALSQAVNDGIVHKSILDQKMTLVPDRVRSVFAA
jgi:hypothetical protein